MVPVETRYARSGDVHIAYRVTGEGPMDLLLAPDGSIPIESMDEEPSFSRFLHRLGAFSRVIRYDRRGTGLSDPVTLESPPTLDQWREDAEAVLEAVGCRRVALLGLAEGGLVLCLLAATRPERVSALVLVNSMAAMDAEPFRGWGLAAEAHERLAREIDTEWGNVAWSVALYAPSAAEDAGYREWLARAMRRFQSPATAAAMHDVMYRSDISDVLPAVRVPTLVIHRSGNRFLTPEHGRYLAEHIPDARYVEVSGKDHVPYLGDQAPILDAIEGFIAGDHRPARATRFLATVLFTDIVDSARTAAGLGDRAWRDLLQQHHDLVRAQLARFGGSEIDTAGDGFFATFDGPASAIRCACSISVMVRRLGLEVRAGVHTGECELVDDKPGGIAVVLGARIAAQAAGGEVLASRTVKDLVAGSGVVFEDRGLFPLKGIDEAWRLFAVDQSSIEG